MEQRTRKPKLPDGLRRLTILSRFLRKLSDEEKKHFDLEYWVAHSDERGFSVEWGGNPHLKGRKITRKRLATCGTIACAVGWAMAIPALRKEGFRESQDDAICPVFEDAKSFGAVRRFFDLTSDEAERLFVGASYPVEERDSAAVAARIEEFVARRSRG